MILLNEKTKQAQYFINAYNHHNANDIKNYGNSLFEIYNSFSKAKDDALKDCLKLRNELNGFNACFCGWSPDIFSYGFLIKENDNKYLIYITFKNTYKILYESGVK